MFEIVIDLVARKIFPRSQRHPNFDNLREQKAENVSR